MRDLVILAIHLIATIAKLLIPGGARAVLAKHYRPIGGSDGPSWLTFLGHAKDSLWNVDLFRCESLSPKTHWVMVVVDQFPRRVIVSPCNPAWSMARLCAASSTR